MPKQYFEYFPTSQYTIDDYKDVTIKDIFRRVIVKLQKYDNQDFQITRDQRPEMVASDLYDSPFYHWVILLTNAIIDPVNDWYMDDKFFKNYLDLKYPNNSLRLNTNHFDSDTIRFFIEGETITGGTSGATAQVVKFDPELLQVTFKYDSGSQVFAKGETITGGTSEKTGAVIQVEKELDAISHYVYIKETTTTANSQDRTTTEAFVVRERTSAMFSGSNASSYSEVTNYTNEYELNLEKSKIFYIPSENMNSFENEFKNIVASSQHG